MPAAPVRDIGADVSGILTQEGDGFRFLAVKNALASLDGKIFDSPENALRAIAASLFQEPPSLSHRDFLAAPFRSERSRSFQAKLEKLEK
ncbi:hypothetical protein [uncultured Rhodoblastus sp.]|uniref:hypothetical protein n=1 Tax=uncultured Rhodoblastus sp. TaxID=543037 RepID=UPI0025D77C18|nr:hypothetical protein [uncultured Rhodoblastus sp.]